MRRRPGFLYMARIFRGAGSVVVDGTYHTPLRLPFSLSESTDSALSDAEITRQTPAALADVQLLVYLHGASATSTTKPTPRHALLRSSGPSATTI